MAKKRAVKASAKGAAESTRPDGSSPHTKLELASPVAAVVNLQNIFAEEYSAKRSRQTFDSEAGADIKVEIANATIIKHQTDDKQFYVTLSFVLKAFDKRNSNIDNNDDGPVVEIKCTFVLHYKISNSDGLKDENFFAFGETSGVFSAWPYWRAYVHETTLRLSVPPIVLPTFRI